jgi:hypothetical protein
MSREQKELLYEIACLHSRKFYLAMKDTWDWYDSNLDMEFSQQIRKLENEYKTTYGDLPEWELIDDVWDTIKTLKEELGV